jgi:hypothetical protein
MQAMFKDGFFDLFANTVRVWPPRPGITVYKALGTIGLIVTSDLIKLLT